ncbi:hypothetical protein DZ959_010165, partial [Pseudomonas aeruginosa]|nr:hypothetical protein [Pseudomonas aeruginosa]
MKLFQRTAKDGNELGDLLEPEKKPRKAASERADGKDLLPGIGASLLGVALVLGLVSHNVLDDAERQARPEVAFSDVPLRDGVAGAAAAKRAMR